MRRILPFAVLLLCLACAGMASAATYKLANGQELTGELLPTSANEQGVQVKVGEGQYERTAWEKFAQEELKKFAQDPKLLPFVEPFIEVTQEEKLKQTEVNIKPPERLPRPAPGSILGGMFTSGPGLFMLLMIYLATIYAGYEVAIFRAQPPGLVVGLSAIPFLGILAPIAFLAMPTRIKPGDDAAPTASAPAPEAGSDESLNPMQDASVEHPSGLKVAHEEPSGSDTAVPQPTVYQRGEFTFNRRFLETKFSNFFGVVRRDADKDMVIVVKSSRGHYVGTRIARSSAADFHLEVQQGGAKQEVTIPYMEIQEMRLQHKDTKS